jgi:uncharacterized protein YndB with AHSA1/START domain
MTKLHVEAEGVTRADPEQVWPLLADATTYADWGPWTASGYEDDDASAVGRVGAIRWMRYGRTTTVERVDEIDEGRRLVYSVVRGIPVHHYRAEVILDPVADGTHIRWYADWDTTLAGRLVRRKLRQIYPDVMARLVATADARAAAR